MMRMIDIYRMGLLLQLAVSCVSARSQNCAETYSFFVAGHVYGAIGTNNIGVHPPFKEKFPYIQSRSEIEFGLFTGDIVSSNPTAQDWDEIDADVENLGIPVHFVAGNHEVRNLPLFKERYGDTYFDFTYNNDLFIILDPNIDGWSITGDQLAFLENVVSEKGPISDNVFVFFHQILWKDYDNEFNFITWNSNEGRVDPVNFWPTVIPIFESISNDVYMFAGDLGASWSSEASYDRYHNITLISSGMGALEGDNFVVVNVDANNSVNYDLICLNGSDLFCLGELTDYLTVDISPSTEAEVKTNTRFIHPNPANEFINVSFKQASTLQLFDLKGALILEIACEEFSNRQIDVSPLQKGVYTARLLGEKGIETQKIVIQ